MTLNSIGSLRNAATALEFDRSVNGWDTPAPKNKISYLGSGWSRNVYRIGSVVYKVQAEMDYACNLNEWDNIQKAMPLLPRGYRIPLTNLYMVDDSPIIAMRYVPGVNAYTVPGADDALNYINRHLGACDLWGSNVLHYRNEWWLIDLGESDLSC